LQRTSGYSKVNAAKSLGFCATRAARRVESSSASKPAAVGTLPAPICRCERNAEYGICGRNEHGRRKNNVCGAVICRRNEHETGKGNLCRIGFVECALGRHG